MDRNNTLFELSGIPPISKSIPLALQHLIAMIVGCITPSIIVGTAADLADEQIVVLIQSGLLMSGIATIIQLFPLFSRIGAKLPIIFGVSFAYVPVLVSIAETTDMATIFGAQIIGALVAIAFGLIIGKVRKLFPAFVTGTVVIAIGLSLYPSAIDYMAGGEDSLTYGVAQNWIVAIITLCVVLYFSFFTKGFLRLASILFGIIIGYIISVCLGMVDFSGLQTAHIFSAPKLLPFGIKFDIAAIVPMIIIFIINSVQVMGEVAATTSGAMDRLPSDKELSGGISGNGFASLIGAFFGGLPTSTFGQNVGIVTSTKIINGFVLLFTAIFMLIAGFMPVLGAVLTSIPECVLGGATLSVFATITMTGVKLITDKPLTPRVLSIVGIALALGVGIAGSPQSLSLAPEWMQTLFGSSSVVIVTIVAVLLNLIIPKEKVAEK